MVDPSKGLEGGFEQVNDGLVVGDVGLVEDGSGCR